MGIGGEEERRGKGFNKFFLSTGADFLRKYRFNGTILLKHVVRFCSRFLYRNVGRPRARE